MSRLEITLSAETPAIENEGLQQRRWQNRMRAQALELLENPERQHTPIADTMNEAEPTLWAELLAIAGASRKTGQKTPTTVTRWAVGTLLGISQASVRGLDSLNREEQASALRPKNRDPSREREAPPAQKRP